MMTSLINDTNRIGTIALIIRIAWHSRRTWERKCTDMFSCWNNDWTTTIEIIRAFTVIFLWITETFVEI